MDLGDRRIRRGIICLVGYLAVGCGPEERLRADLQLDVVGATLTDTDWVRICVEDAMVHETPLGDGRIAIPGIPAAGTLTVSVHARGEDGSTGKTEPVFLNKNSPWARTEWSRCSPLCSPCTIEKSVEAVSDENARLLSIHFVE